MPCDRAGRVSERCPAALPATVTVAGLTGSCVTDAHDMLFASPVPALTAFMAASCSFLACRRL